jgi:PTH1 family peptidyl-tRNA hydrolase
MQGRSSDTWLIVGLGNPGREYEKTRHNAGFRAMDILAQKLGCQPDKLKYQGLYCQATYQGKKLLLLKPQTYMNLSGRSAAPLASFFKVPASNIIVLFDDISLPPGRLRIRSDGSAGGHNGIKSLIQSLGSDQFPRIKRHILQQNLFAIAEHQHIMGFRGHYFQNKGKIRLDI